MRIDLGRTDTAVAQKLLEGQNVHIAGLIHQGRSRVTELMRRKTAQTRRFHCSCHQLLYPAVGNALFAPPGDKDRSFLGVQAFHRVAFVQIDLQGLDAGIVQIDHPLLVALTEQTDLPLFHVDVTEIHPHKFRKTHSTVQKEHHHTVIPLGKIALGLGAFQ